MVRRVPSTPPVRGSLLRRHGASSSTPSRSRIEPCSGIHTWSSSTVKCWSSSWWVRRNDATHGCIGNRPSTPWTTAVRSSASRSQVPRGGGKYGFHATMLYPCDVARAERSRPAEGEFGEPEQVLRGRRVLEVPDENVADVLPPGDDLHVLVDVHTLQTDVPVREHQRHTDHDDERDDAQELLAIERSSSSMRSRHDNLVFHARRPQRPRHPTDGPVCRRPLLLALPHPPGRPRRARRRTPTPPPTRNSRPFLRVTGRSR